MPGAPRAKTEQMPMLKRPVSRRFDPLPVQEPSVVVRPSLAMLPESSGSATASATTASASTASATTASKTEPASEVREAPSDAVALPRSNTPLIAGLGAVVLVLAVALGVLFTRPSEADQQAPVTAEVQPPPKADPAPPPPAVEKPAEPVADTSPLPEPARPAVAPPEPAVTAPVDAGKVEVAELDKPSPKRPDAAPAPRKMGSLVIKAVPFATVTILGKSYEVMGVKTVPAPAGTYEISLKHPKKQAKERVTVPANGSASVNFSAD